MSAAHASSVNARHSASTTGKDRRRASPAVPVGVAPLESMGQRAGWLIEQGPELNWYGHSLY